MTKKPFLTSSECAEFLGIKCATFLKNYAPLPDFPRRIKLPMARKPLWEREEVLEWIRKYKES